MEVIVQIYRSWALKINKVYLDITNILVVLLKICQIEVFNITNTQYNKQISPALWHFVKSVFHYMSSLLFFQLQEKGMSTPKWHVIWAYIKYESHSFQPIIISCRGNSSEVHRKLIPSCIHSEPVLSTSAWKNILTRQLSMSEFIQCPKGSTSKLHCTMSNNFCGNYKVNYNMNREYSVCGITIIGMLVELMLYRFATEPKVAADIQDCLQPFFDLVYFDIYHDSQSI